LLFTKIQEILYSVYWFISLLLSYMWASSTFIRHHAPFPAMGRKRLLGSDFLKCFIDIFIHINSVATPRNKIKTYIGWGIRIRKKKALANSSIFWPFITCPVLSEISLNYYFFQPATCKRLSESIMRHKHVCWIYGVHKKLN